MTMTKLLTNCSLKSPFLYLFKPRKVGWGLHEVGGSASNTLKRIRTGKRGEETKILKKGANWVKEWVP